MASVEEEISEDAATKEEIQSKAATKRAPELEPANACKIPMTCK
jgi:hypothetical protein